MPIKNRFLRSFCVGILDVYKRQLLTLSAGHKQGKSGENDTRFGLEVNYRIGEPLEKQLEDVYKRQILDS